MTVTLHMKPCENGWWIPDTVCTIQQQSLYGTVTSIISIHESGNKDVKSKSASTCHHFQLLIWKCVYTHIHIHRKSKNKQDILHANIHLRVHSLMNSTLNSRSKVLTSGREGFCSFFFMEEVSKCVLNVRERA